MNYSIEQSEITRISEDLNNFSALIDLYSEDRVEESLLMVEISRFESIKWENENFFNQMFAYTALGAAFGVLKSKKLDFKKAYYTNEYVYKEISYYHNVQYIVSRVAKEQWAALFDTAFHTYCRAYLCLANAYDHLGRFCEAQQYYRLAALDKCNKKDVEINQGFSFANIHAFWENEEPWIIRQAQILLSKYPNDIDEKAIGLREYICGFKAPSCDMPIVDFSTMTEGKYEKWVNVNFLRINRYCDVDCYSTLSLEDNVKIHSIQASNEKQELFASMYDEITRLFVSTRKMLYSLTVSIGECDTELLKMAYKNFYSILDKVALFVSLYLNLPIEPHRVDFSTIWIDKKNKEIRPLILDNKNNMSLLALYNIKLDIYGGDKVDYVIDEQTKDLKRIRNFIEHKFIKIQDGPMVYNEYQLTISKKELSLNTIRLAQLVRCAIIYLCNFVIHAEYDKKNAL